MSLSLQNAPEIVSQSAPEIASQSKPTRKSTGWKDIYEDFGSPKRKIPIARRFNNSIVHPTSEGTTELAEKYSLKPDYWTARQDKVSKYLLYSIYLLNVYSHQS
jgi:hypothetical protein